MCSRSFATSSLLLPFITNIKTFTISSQFENRETPNNCTINSACPPLPSVQPHNLLLKILEPLGMLCLKPINSSLPTDTSSMTNGQVLRFARDKLTTSCSNSEMQKMLISACVNLIIKLLVQFWTVWLAEINQSANYVSCTICSSVH
jgi:hypothetical protein